MLRKFHILGAAFFAVLAFGVISVASASALTLQWLLNGKEITTATHAVVEGKWLMLGLSSFFGETHVVCNGILLGTVGPGAADLVSKVYGLKGESETKINCEVLHEKLGACPGSLLALVEAENLPWKTELLLPAAGEIVDHFTEEKNGNPAFLLKCTNAIGGTILILCLSKSILTKPLVNETGGVSGSILNQLSDSCPLNEGDSSLVSHIYAEGLISALAGTLSVSD